MSRTYPAGQSMLMEPSTPPVVQAIDVDHLYHGRTGWKRRLDHLNLEVSFNGLMCILGPSVRGKSTFPRIVAGLTRPTSGEVLLHSQPIKGPGLDRGVFPDPVLFARLNVDLPRSRDRHSTAFLAMKSQVQQEMRRHGILTD